MRRGLFDVTQFADGDSPVPRTVQVHVNEDRPWSSGPVGNDGDGGPMTE